MELQIKVAQAVHVLNHDSQSCNRVAANQWLVQFQQTDLAWDVATSILTSDHHRHHHSFLSDFEVEFFAAQILKRKVSIPSLTALSLSLSLSLSLPLRFICLCVLDGHPSLYSLKIVTVLFSVQAMLPFLGFWFGE